MILQETGKLINSSPDPILIVDDDRKMRVIMKALIESSGWTAVEACDGVQALEMYSKERPSVVLLDMLMPKMDGLETLDANTQTVVPFNKCHSNACVNFQKNLSRVVEMLQCDVQEGSLRRAVFT